MVFGLIVACFKPNGNTSMAEAMGNAQIEDSDDDRPLFHHHHPLPMGEPLVLMVIELVPLIVVPFGDLPELVPDSDDEPLFPGPIAPLNPGPVTPPAVIMVHHPLPIAIGNAQIEDSDDDRPLFHHHHPLPMGEPLVLVVIEPVPLMVVPFGDLPELVPDSDDDEMVEEPDDEDEAMPTLIPDDDDENEYDHIDNRAIYVTLDMPSANPNIMNVTSRHQDKYANLSC